MLWSRQEAIAVRINLVVVEKWVVKVKLTGSTEGWDIENESKRGKLQGDRPEGMDIWWSSQQRLGSLNTRMNGDPPSRGGEGSGKQIYEEG